MNNSTIQIINNNDTDNSNCKKINILEQPTFDLTEWRVIKFDTQDKILFCQTKQIFRFDKCKGTIMPRSRILRTDKKESELVENIISATIDSGFTGKLVFKLKLTINGSKVFFESNESRPLRVKESDINQQISLIQNSVQIDLHPFPVNYYGDGHTNYNPDLTPEVIFYS